MAVAVAVHRVEHADIVNHAADVGEEVADPDAALAVLLEAPAGLDEEAVELAGLVEPARRGDGLAVVARELGLVVEGVHLRNAAGGVEEDDAVGLRGEVAGARGKRVRGGRLGFVAKASEGEGTEAAGGAAEEFAAG